MSMSATEMIAKQIAGQHELQLQFLRLAHAQADVLRQSDVDALNALVSEQQEAILALGRMNREWLAAMPALTESLGIAESATLSELIDALPEQERAELHAEAEAMRATMRAVYDQNSSNMDVISFEAKIEDQFMREIVLQPIGDDGSDFARQPRLVDVEA